jgi:hypothetical protein
VALTDLRLLTSTRTWLLLMSRNSALKIVSSSTAKTCALLLPLEVSLRRPRNLPGSAADSTALSAATKKARPLLLRSAYCP